MAPGHLGHHRHEQKVVVVCEVHLLVDRGTFELVGGYFVVAGLDRNAQTVTADFEVEHEGLYARWYRTEIVVFKLLVLGALMPHEGAACHHQVGTRAEKRFVDKEIFLFPAEIGNHMLDFGVEETRHSRTGFVDCVD